MAVPRSYLSVPDERSMPARGGLGADPPRSGIVIELRPGAAAKVDQATGTVTRDDGHGGLEILYPGAQKAERQSTRREGGSFDDNLADLDGVPAGHIAITLLEGIQADEESRREWVETADKAADYWGTKIEEPQATPTAQGSVARTQATVLIEACVREWANAYAELCPAAGPVKVEDDDPEDPATQQIDQPADAAPVPGVGHNGGPPLERTRSEVADALAKDFNHYLTKVDKEYYPDMARMLMSRGLIGMAFRKVYRDPIKRRPVSRWTKAQDLIVSQDCVHLSGASRITERIKMRGALVKRLQKVGHYLDIDLPQPAETVTPTEAKVGDLQGVRPMPSRPQDNRREILECYCELDDGPLAEDENGHVPGFPLSYRVSIDRDSQRVLEIRRNWKEGDPDYQARQRYVTYGYIPGLGFYHLGLIHLVGNQQRAATALQRGLIDAGMFSSFPGGAIAAGPNSRESTTEIRPGPGQFVKIKLGAVDDIRKVLAPLPYKDPSPTVLGLLTKIEQDGRRLAGVIEMPVGEGRSADVPVGTMMAYVETVSQVNGAVHKTDHTAQAEEFALLKELFEEEPEALWRGVKKPARKWQIAAEIAEQDLIPVSDPNTPSQIHRLMKAQAAIQLGGLPQFQGIMNQQALAELGLRTLGQNPEEFIEPPPPPGAQPPPDPKVQVAQINAESQQVRSAAQLQQAQEETKVKAMGIQADMQQSQAELDSKERQGAMELAARREETAHDAAATMTGLAVDHHHQTADRAQDHAHHVDEMAQSAMQQADQGGAADDAATGKPPGGLT